MAKQFKIKYATRAKLQRAIQQQIKRLGLVDTGALESSVRVSSATGDLNKLYITINAIYYYMFLDKGAELWNGGRIEPYFITQSALESSLGQQFQTEAVDAYVEWMMANYPILDVGKIMVDNLQVEIKYNLFGADGGKWNGEFDYDKNWKWGV
jgi:hypothetical protein